MPFYDGFDEIVIKNRPPDSASHHPQNAAPVTSDEPRNDDTYLGEAPSPVAESTLTRTTRPAAVRMVDS